MLPQRIEEVLNIFLHDGLGVNHLVAEHTVVQHTLSLLCFLSVAVLDEGDSVVEEEMEVSHICRPSGSSVRLKHS